MDGGFTKFLNSRGLAIFMLIVALVIFGFLIANAVYFNKIKNDPNQSSVSQSDAKTFLIINSILAAVMFLFIIYYAAKSVVTNSVITKIKTDLEAKGNQLWAGAERGYQTNIADPLQKVYQAGVEAGQKSYAAAETAANNAASAAAAAYTAATLPYAVAPTFTNSSGQSQTVVLYHQGGGVYKDPTTNNLYNCKGDVCQKLP